MNQLGCCAGRRDIKNVAFLWAILAVSLGLAQNRSTLDHDTKLGREQENGLF